MKNKLFCIASASLLFLTISNFASTQGDVLSDYRFRSQFELPLNADSGWAAKVNQPAKIPVDQPYRLRLQIVSREDRDFLRHYVLWYRLNEDRWQPVLDADFPYPAYASPIVSLVSPPYPEGTKTEDLLAQGEMEHGEDGTGQSIAPVSTRAGECGVATEWEFPLVVRYFADGPICLNHGDSIQFRLRHLHGDFLPSAVSPKLTVVVPEGHLGGTFVETPGRIGPWASDRGDLYFIMEPTETDNRFMIVKSNDRGKTWREVDGGNRPPARDLEAVDAIRIGNLLHIIHMEDVIWYHSFQMSSEENPFEGWISQSELIGEPAKPPVQSVGLEILGDGTLLAIHADGPHITIRGRDPEGSWPIFSRMESSTRFSGIQAVRAGPSVYIVYTEGNGKAWLQRIQANGQAGQRWLLSASIGTSEADVGSILTPVFIPGRNQIALVYREQEGNLSERRFDLATDYLSEPRIIVSDPVVQNAVDSDQTGADLVLEDDLLHLFYIPEKGRGLFHKQSNGTGKWSEPKLLVDEIEASWVRASTIESGNIGVIYDAGSLGGSGMNRYLEVRGNDPKEMLDSQLLPPSRTGNALPARKALRLNQRDFPRLSGTSPAAIRIGEQGRTRIPRMAKKLMHVDKRHSDILPELTEVDFQR
jgi:hypothetical protein